MSVHDTEPGVPGVAPVACDVKDEIREIGSGV